MGGENIDGCMVTDITPPNCLKSIHSVLSSKANKLLMLEVSVGTFFSILSSCI